MPERPVTKGGLHPAGSLRVEARKTEGRSPLAIVAAGFLQRRLVEKITR